MEKRKLKIAFSPADIFGHAGIARKAELALATISKFFRNKEDLSKTLIMEQIDRFQAALTQVVEKADDEMEKLRNYIRIKASSLQDNEAVVRLYFAETRGASFNTRAGPDKEIRAEHDLFLQKLALVCEKGIQKQQFRNIGQPYRLAFALDSLTSIFLYLWLEEPVRHPFPGDPDIILNILFQRLLAP